MRARLTEGRRELLVSASLFRQESASLFLIRLIPLDADAGAVVAAKAKSTLLTLVQNAPDGFVVTEPGRPHHRRPMPPSWIWPSSRPRSRRWANRSSAGSAGPGSTSMC